MLPTLILTFWEGKLKRTSLFENADHLQHNTRQESDLMAVATPWVTEFGSPHSHAGSFVITTAVAASAADAWTEVVKSNKQYTI